MFPSFPRLVCFPEFANLGQELRSVSSLPCCQPSSSAGGPCLCPPPGFRKKDTSASVPLRFFTSLCPCLQQDLKTVMERYTWELNHVCTCRVTLAKPECLSSGSWSRMRWLLGCLVHAPCSPYTQGKPGLPTQVKRYMDFEAHRVCFFISVFCMNLTSLVEKGHLFIRGQIWVFFH